EVPRLSRCRRGADPPRAAVRSTQASGGYLGLPADGNRLTMGYRTAGVSPAMGAPCSLPGAGSGPRSCLITIALALCAAVPALAQDTERPTTVLHLSQAAERTVVRDLLRIELRVEASGADAQTVQAEINRRMAAALDRARQVQGVKVETGFYDVG